MDFKNTVIIMTSNMGAERIQAHARRNESFEELKEDMNRILRNTLRPEFVNRIDEVIVFRALTKDQIADIARLLLERTQRRLRAQDIEVEFTQEATELLAEEGFDPEFGARPLRRTIQRRVDNDLSRMVLDGSLNPGDEVVVGAEEGKLTFEVLESTATVGTADRNGGVGPADPGTEAESRSRESPLLSLDLPVLVLKLASCADWGMLWASVGAGLLDVRRSSASRERTKRSAPHPYQTGSNR